MRRRHFVPALLLTLAACGREPPRTPAPGARAGETGVAGGGVVSDAELAALPPDSARVLFVRRGLVPIGETRRAIRETLGEPDSVATRTLPNRHLPAQTDTIVTLHYDALAAVVHVASGRDLLTSVRITDNRWLRVPVVRIGMPWAEARRRLGPPHERTREGYLYSCTECGVVDEPVIFAVRDGLVQAIEFTFYVD